MSKKEIAEKKKDKKQLISDDCKEFLNKEETLEEKYDRKNNIFDYIRILLAIFVIVAHCYPLFFGPTAVDPISFKILKTESLGGVAVAGFFILSGFMITQSMLNSKNHKQFIGKRLIRIFPALIVMLLLTVFVLGPVVYDGNNIGDYFKDKTTWKYLINNINLFGNTEYNINGVFTNNPYSPAINGSLWSLKHEFIAYFVLVLFSLCSVLKNKKAMLTITITCGLMYLLDVKLISIFTTLNCIGVVLEIGQFIKLMTYFMIGSTMYLYKDKIVMSFKYFIFMLIVLLAGIVLNGTKYVLVLAMPYILMYIGTFSFKKDILKKIGDFSYALYIYAFPIQQLLVFYLGQKITIWAYLALSIVTTTIVSIIMTLIVDNNTKRIKEKLFNSSKA